MKYMCLIYGQESQWAKMSEAEQGAMFGEHMAFTEAITQAGKYVGGEALEPTQTATTVRVRNGKTQTTDGPFAETQEQLGGYYIIEAKDLDEAVAIAARIPDARYGSVEVRPVMVIPDM